jgi:hypothetical protein
MEISIIEFEPYKNNTEIELIKEPDLLLDRIEDDLITLERTSKSFSVIHIRDSVNEWIRILRKMSSALDLYTDC